MNPERNRVRVRPGRGASLVAGIAALMMGLFVFVATSSFLRPQFGGGPFGTLPGGPPPIFGAFPLFFFLFALLIAGVALYNAFSERGIASYEIDVERGGDGGEGFCPNCGQRVAPADRFCRHCGASLEQVSKRE